MGRREQRCSVRTAFATDIISFYFIYVGLIPIEEWQMENIMEDLETKVRTFL